MVTIENLTFKYGRKKAPIFSNFHLDFEDGKIYGLLGKNGTGKSTLLYLMTGLLTPDNGKVFYNNINVRKRLPETLQSIFLVPEEFDLPPVELSVFIRENAPFYPRFSMHQMEEFLHIFGLNTNINLGALSMGQKKKVYMSFALATNTELLIMDEPTNGLDIPAKSQFRKIISGSMNDKRTIIISTHQVRDVENLLDHIIIIEPNDVLLDAPISFISSRLLFMETYNPELIDGALYVQPSLQGFQVVLPNKDHQESAVNLEILFNAILDESAKTVSQFY